MEPLESGPHPCTEWETGQSADFLAEESSLNNVSFQFNNITPL